MAKVEIFFELHKSFLQKICPPVILNLLFSVVIPCETTIPPLRSGAKVEL
ncbi:hypothetical protein HMPREF0766_11625 [Sphingobacterium spiritivorum ATCC 33861]|uniref:Uncharacterized protein n=1 Tax=Sphingobacterium spiritivorum ATCC 33861 TaxID=525373 RepID=D7VKV6_SPHSI|nr:hypothetical protein HMPREF0766_11625 [Sphingobacterium spiritivorum ATCC 33861]